MVTRSCNTIPASGRLRQEDSYKFEASLGCKVSSVQKQTNKNSKNKNKKTLQQPRQKMNKKMGLEKRFRD